MEYKGSTSQPHDQEERSAANGIQFLCHYRSASGAYIPVRVYLAYLTGYLNLYFVVSSSNCCLPTMFLVVLTSFLLTGFLFFLSGKRYCSFLEKDWSGSFPFSESLHWSFIVCRNG